MEKLVCSNCGKEHETPQCCAVEMVWENQKFVCKKCGKDLVVYCCGQPLNLGA